MLCCCIHQRREAPVHTRAWEHRRADYIKSLIRGCCFRASCIRQQDGWWIRNPQIFLLCLFCSWVLDTCQLNSGSGAVSLCTVSNHYHVDAHCHVLTEVAVVVWDCSWCYNWTLISQELSQELSQSIKALCQNFWNLHCKALVLWFSCTCVLVLLVFNNMAASVCLRRRGHSKWLACRFHRPTSQLSAKTVACSQSATQCHFSNFIVDPWDSEVVSSVQFSLLYMQSFYWGFQMKLWMFHI